MLALFDRFPQPLRLLLYRLPLFAREELEEIRLRSDRPVQLRLRRGCFFADKQGRLQAEPEGARTVSAAELRECLEQFCSSSLYACEYELSCGFLTLSGGHRVGFCGTCRIRGGGIVSLQEISSLNVRVARQIFGIADPLLPRLTDGRRVFSTLIVSPPGCGKTTLLRELARTLSERFTVCIADERGELGATSHGTPGLKVGDRTDVLDGCPKADGMMMLLRSMSPEVIVTDEIGSEQDRDAIRAALLSGVSVIASAHGRDRGEILRRMPEIAPLFERFVTLDRADGSYRIAAIENGD